MRHGGPQGVLGGNKVSQAGEVVTEAIVCAQAATLSEELHRQAGAADDNACQRFCKSNRDALILIRA